MLSTCKSFTYFKTFKFKKIKRSYHITGYYLQFRLQSTMGKAAVYTSGSYFI